jgi:hypothetical protein
MQAPEIRKFRDDWVDRVAARRKIADPENRPSIRVKGVQIVESYLVSSFTDNGVGDYTMNFAKSLDIDKLVVHVDGDEPLQYKIDSQSGSGCSVRIKFTDRDHEAPSDPRIFLATFDDGSK